MSRSARRQARRVPLRFDDGFRGTIAMLVALPFMVPLLSLRLGGSDVKTLGAEVGFAGLSLTVFSLVYVLWTHWLFHRTPPERVAQIAAEQHRRGPSRLERWMGFAGAANWAIWAAIAAILVAMATAIVWYSDRSLWLPLIALATAATSWVLTVYAFALRYLRLHSADERFEFDIRESPIFTDFLSLSMMVATVAALSAAVPRTRAALRAVRVQTVIAFTFNSVVIATTVSLVLGLLNAG